MDIFVSGRLGFDRAQSLCQTYFSWSRRPTPKPLLDPPVAAGPRVLNVAEPRLGQGRLVMGCRTDLGPNHTDQPALILFNALLGGDSHSRLFRHLREGAGLCYYIHSYLESLSQLLLVEAGIEEGDYQQVQREIGAQIEAIGSGRFADEEMDQVKHVLLRRLETMGDNREGLMRFYFRQQLDGTNWDRQELWRRLVAVGRTELARAAKGIHLDTVFFLHSPNFEPQA